MICIILQIIGKPNVIIVLLFIQKTTTSAYVCKRIRYGLRPHKAQGQRVLPLMAYTPEKWYIKPEPEPNRMKLNFVEYLPTRT